MTEHEKSRDRRVQPAVLGLCGGAYAAQEVTVSKLVPGVSVVGEPVALSVGAHGRGVVLAYAHPGQGPGARPVGAARRAHQELRRILRAGRACRTSHLNFLAPPGGRTALVQSVKAKP